MTTNSELFWGPNSIMMLPYMSSVGDAQSAFFQRMTGLGFAIMSLGYAKCGVSKDAWIKQTMLFHVVSTPIFFLQCASDDGTSFTPWVWYLQIAINVALAGWGYTEMSKSKTKEAPPARVDVPRRGTLRSMKESLTPRRPRPLRSST